MKKALQLKSTVVLGIIGVLALLLLAVAIMVKGGTEQSPELTSNVRAAPLTYKRTLNITLTSPTPFDMFTTPENASDDASLTPTLSATVSATLTISPTEISSPTATLAASASATPTAVSSLPKTGWTQNVSIMFIAASVLMFLSFLF